MRSDAPTAGSATMVELVDGTDCVEVWPLTGVRRDLAMVDALARLQLAARSLGWSIRVRNADDELCRLVQLVGLAGVLPLEPSR